ncbi:hypothetical protein M501DRAFT_1029315 [Patellaria atrata CBS 101060]|uniref:SCP domain-containing protein n=1 Tax=Patellaria atrata CBS 101060 TaxID=1346257 RepID=A0A9P4VRQ2_9PEZI|nr:hypothetical protein M501DRAFT_1029315 [Patellaria atrata CBS 101060]
MLLITQLAFMLILPAINGLPQAQTLAPSFYSPPDPVNVTEPAIRSVQAACPNTSGICIIDVINRWRRRFGKPDMRWDDWLVSTARSTVDYNRCGAKGQSHHMAGINNVNEVITPGSDFSPVWLYGGSPFEATYVIWLCEREAIQLTRDEERQNVNWCTTVVQDIYHIDLRGITGHADTLQNPGLSRIGCAYCANPDNAGKPNGGFPWAGQWACNML